MGELKMDANKRHITQISRADLQEIAAATNPTPGFMIRVEKSQGELKISVDENALKIGVFAFLRNLGAIPQVSPSVEQICNTSMNLQ